jgi:hypothetical protein
MRSVVAIRALVEAEIPSAFAPCLRPELESIPTGIAKIDCVTGGIPLGGLTELCGSNLASSGKSSVLTSLLAAASQKHFCALIDAGDSFDLASAEAAGVDLSRLLWVRCGKNSAPTLQPQGLKPPRTISKAPNARPEAVPFHGSSRQIEKRAFRLRPLEQAFKAADMLLQSSGFGLIAVDVSSIAEKFVRHVPLTTWFRFSRIIEKQRTALVFVEQNPHATSCAALVLRLRTQSGSGPGKLFNYFSMESEILRTRNKKQVQSAPGDFTLPAEWA